jgi:hypothetical protein
MNLKFDKIIRGTRNVTNSKFDKLKIRETRNLTNSKFDELGPYEKNIWRPHQKWIFTHSMTNDLKLGPIFTKLLKNFLQSFLRLGLFTMKDLIMF